MYETYREEIRRIKTDGRITEIGMILGRFCHLCVVREKYRGSVSQTFSKRSTLTTKITAPPTSTESGIAI